MTKYYYNLTFLILFSIHFATAQQNATVQPFLPEVISQFPSVRDFTISPFQDEAYFTAQSHLGEISVIIMIKKENDKWSAPQIATFSGKYHDLEPFLSPDELSLFFASNRPLDNATDTIKDYDIWYVQRADKNAVWSTPKNLGQPVNSEHNEFYPSVANNKNLYFTSDAPGSKGKDDIYKSQWKDGMYNSPVSLSDSINSTGYEFNAFASPDESFLIFSGYNRADGLGSGDLYISYQKEKGIWSKAENLGPTINSDKMDYCPFVDASTKTLFFTSKRVQLDYGTSGFSTVEELLGELNKYENGLSRIYQALLPK